MTAPYYFIDVIKLKSLYLPGKPSDKITKAFSGLFHAVNTTKDGKISFLQCIHATSIALRGTFTERCQFSFRVFDPNQKGNIQLNDIIDLITILNEFQILSIKLEETMEDVKYFFEKNEQLDFEEFQLKSKKNSAFLEGFGLFKYFFSPLIEPIEKFLEPKNYFEKTGYISLEKTTYYAEIKGGILTFYSDKHDPTPSKEIHLITCLSVENIKDTSSFILNTPKKKLTIAADDENEKRDWVYTLLIYISTSTDNRYNSFAPVRKNCSIKYYIDGKDIFNAMAKSIMNAKDSIYLSGWYISPQIYLIRENSSIDYRLDILLNKKAQEGVDIKIILWKETQIASLHLESDYCKKYFEKLNPKIQVKLHPKSFPVLWSHHQKFLLIDQCVCFVGGYDIGFGRYDDECHRLQDTNHCNLTWPGYDYHNSTIKPLSKLQTGKFDCFNDQLDRLTQPRMPWHDIHCSFVGQMVRDVSANFIERWNHHNKDRSSISFSSKAFSNDVNESFENLQFDKRKSSDILNHFDKSGFKCTCQILRSITDWSGSSNNLEQSIYTGMVDLISKAKYYIYIEQQFFISSTAGGGVVNTIADVLLEKLRFSISKKENFKVIIVLPNHPEGLLQDSSTQQILKWQSKTINRGKTSLLSQLENEFPNVKLSDYIIFNTIRSYDFILDKPVTELIYVHSKLMIIDDLYVLTGSANVNDRSLLGSRDSELSIAIEDEEYIKSEMGGESFHAGKFAISMRKKLWKEHLGISNDHLIRDPISKESWDLWNTTSKNNTNILSRVFPYIPSNSIQYLDQYLKLNKEKELGLVELKDIKKELSKVKGHLCDFPLDFLSKESLNVPIERKVILPDNLYQ
eukprot:gene1007-9913_t